jgi:hypothetical protein
VVLNIKFELTSFIYLTAFMYQPDSTAKEVFLTDTVIPYGSQTPPSFLLSVATLYLFCYRFSNFARKIDLTATEESLAKKMMLF